jgi:hypothetical protein
LREKIFYGGEKVGIGFSLLMGGVIFEGCGE